MGGYMGDGATERIEKASQIEGTGFLLDKLAKEGKIGPIYERKDLVEYCTNTLSKGNNLLLAGPHGVGKNAVVESIAIRIANDVAGNLPIKHILETNSSKMLEGCLYTGNLENKVQLLFKNCSEEKTVIFLDNAHLGIGVWSSSESPQNDMISIINNSFLPDTQIICSTTPEGLKMLEGVRPEFVNRFIKIEVKPTSKEETLEILKSTKSEFQNRYKVEISEDVLEKIVQLADCFYRMREFPGKAFELLLRVINENLNTTVINVEDLYKYILKNTGLPSFIIREEESVNKGQINKYFEKFIFGQDEAVDVIIQNILTFKARLNRPGKPVGSFLFCGPSGVGKTELAKVLAKYLFGSENKLFIYSMSQYNDSDGFRKLLGSPTSETRELLYGTGKVLKDVRSTPFTVMLFDEIDQATKSVLNGLYQILDEGRYIQNNGDVTSFESSIIIMSTNLGMEEFFNSEIGFGSQDGSKRANISKKVIDKLELEFGEPFLNRISKIIIFNPLDRNIIEKVVLKIVDDFVNLLPGLIEKNLKIKLDDRVIDFLSENGYNEKYGARNLHRVVNEYCINKISTFLAANPETRNKTFYFKMVKGFPDFELE